MWAVSANYVAVAITESMVAMEGYLFLVSLLFRRVSMVRPTKQQSNGAVMTVVTTVGAGAVVTVATTVGADITVCINLSAGCYITDKSLVVTAITDKTLVVTAITDKSLVVTAITNKSLVVTAHRFSDRPRSVMFLLG
jgi:hypothetical protein